MTTLRITVEWLDGRYHGREWPPAPHRLYQAMLAGFALNARGDPVLEAATGRSPGCSATQGSPRRCSNPQRSSPRRASPEAPLRTGIGARATSPTTPSRTSR